MYDELLCLNDYNIIWFNEETDQVKVSFDLDLLNTLEVAYEGRWTTDKVIEHLVPGKEIILGGAAPAIFKILEVSKTVSGPVTEGRVQVLGQLVKLLEAENIYNGNLKKGIREYTNIIHNMAKDKGWWDNPRSTPEILLLVISEISEATESFRNAEPELHKGKDSAGNFITPDHPRWGEMLKPEGEAVELADAVIRIMDYFGHKGWDLEDIIKTKIAYNATRGHRHGGKVI